MSHLNQEIDPRLAPYATTDRDALWEKNEIINGISPFATDKTLILQSFALRHLANKSQNLVFRSLSDASSRLFHTLQVAEVASKIASGLGLNVPLAEAIAFGHDIGHMPFSHNAQIGIDRFLGKAFVGEERKPKDALFSQINDEETKKMLKKYYYVSPTDKGIFAHQKQSFHIIHEVDKNLSDNLTLNTRVGVLHNHEPKPLGYLDLEKETQALSFEMFVVEISDYITWPNNDLEEAMKKGFIKAEFVYDAPIVNGHTVGSLLGLSYEERITRFIEDVIEFNSKQQKLEKFGFTKGQKIQLSPNFITALDVLKNIVFDQVLNSRAVATRAQAVQNALTSFMEIQFSDWQEENPNLSIEDKVLFCRKLCDDIWKLSDYDLITSIRKSNSLNKLDFLLDDCKE